MPRSLHARLTLALLGLLLVVGAFGLFHTLRTSRLYAREVQQELHRGLAQHVVDHQELLVDGEIHDEALADLFHSLMVINPDIEVYLLDTDGRILSFFAPEGEVRRRRVSLEPVHRLLEEGAALPVLGDDPRSLGDRKIFSAAPIRQEGQVTGWLYIVLASQEHASVAQMVQGSRLLTSAVGIAAVALLLALAGGLFLFRHLTRRLRRLAEEIQALEEEVPNHADEADPAAGEAGDEVDRLRVAFQRMRTRIRKQILDLEETDRLRRELVANVSHDLRTPLAHLEGYLETLLLKEEALTDEERREYVEIALQQSRRLERLVSQLLELARLEARQVSAQWEEFSLAELVQDVVQKFRLEATEKGVALQASLPESLALVSADLGLIERVLVNLLENAVRHTPPGGEIAVDLEARDGRVHMEIRDTGPGIPAEDRERIFERFHRGASGHEGGLGLGLAIARRALELHDSKLSCRDNRDGGTIFAFDLPAPPAASAHQQASGDA